jgi:predicted Zn finger-like uncharacterized protein
MVIVLDCPGCGKRYEVDESLAGKKSRCKQCGEVFLIPVPRRISPPAPKKVSKQPQNSSAGEWQTAAVDPRPSARSGRDNSQVRPGGNLPVPDSRTIVLNCPNCQKRYEIDEALAGKKSRCKDCGEVFSIPVPRGWKSDGARSSREPAAAPADHWGALLDDEPASFKASRGAASPVYEEQDLPPPPRASYPEPTRRSKSSYGHRGGSTDVGLTLAGCYLGLALLVVVGFFLWMAAASPPKERIGQIFAIMVLLLHGTALLLSFSGSIWILVIAFTESVAQGLLCLLVPCYVLFFVSSRWEETRGAFTMEVLPVANTLAFIVIGFAIGMAGKADALNDLANGGGNQNDGIALAGDPQQDLPQPGFPPPGFPQPGPPQPGFAPPPGFPQPEFPAPGAGPQQGRRGFGPGNRRFARPGQGAPGQPFAGQADGRAVYLTITGIPTNSDPVRGVTARDVSEAIKARARQLAPTATHFTWIGRRNQASLMLSPVDDIQGFANRIDFGTVTVRGNQLNVTVSPDFIASVPRLPAEQSQTPDINPSPRAANRDPEIPADADAVTRSLIQLKADASHTKKDGLNRLMRTQPDERLAEVVQAILPLLEDDDGFLVSDAVKTLVIWRSPEVVPALAKLTNDNRFNVRHEAIKALGKIKDPRGVEPVVQRIKEDGFQAEDALKEMGSIAEAALIERLTNPDSGVRRRVCEILKEIGGKQALMAMTALPADPDLGVRMAAKDAMSSITLRVGPLTPAERKKATGGSSSRSGSRR